MNFDICIIDKRGGWQQKEWGKDTLQCSIVICKVALQSQSKSRNQKLLILVEQHHPPQALSAIAGGLVPLLDDVTHCDELWNVSHSIKLSSLSFFLLQLFSLYLYWTELKRGDLMDFRTVGGSFLYAVHFKLKITKLVLLFQEECLLNYNFIICTMSR